MSLEYTSNDTLVVFVTDVDIVMSILLMETEYNMAHIPFQRNWQ